MELENLQSKYHNTFTKNKLFVGRMLSGSKSRYQSSNPFNLIVFNANIIILTHTKKPIKIWYGDLDINKDGEILKKISKELNTELFIFREMDFRFGNENKTIMDYSKITWSTSKETPNLSDNDIELLTEISLIQKNKSLLENNIYNLEKKLLNNKYLIKPNLEVINNRNIIQKIHFNEDYFLNELDNYVFTKEQIIEETHNCFDHNQFTYKVLEKYLVEQVNLITPNTFEDVKSLEVRDFWGTEELFKKIEKIEYLYLLQKYNFIFSNFTDNEKFEDLIFNKYKETPSIENINHYWLCKIDISLLNSMNTHRDSICNSTIYFLK